jgi:hypothetical protein
VGGVWGKRQELKNYVIAKSRHCEPPLLYFGGEAISNITSAIASDFLYSLLYPRWHNALGQLLSFLAYDLVLIIPFLLLFKTVKPEYMLNLVVYVAVLIYSGAIAVYFLFVNSQTRFGS